MSKEERLKVYKEAYEQGKFDATIEKSQEIRELKKKNKLLMKKWKQLKKYVEILIYINI